MKKYVFCLLILLVPSLAFGATRTVGPGKTHATIQAAVSASSCGDVIDVYDDTYNETVTLNDISCSSGSPLTIKAASGEVGVIMDASDTVKYAFTIKRSSNIIIQGPLLIRNYLPNYGTDDGIFQIGSGSGNGSNDITVDNITIHAEGRSNSYTDTGNYDNYTTAFGIEYSTDVIIKNCTIYGRGNGTAGNKIDGTLQSNLDTRLILRNNYWEAGRSRHHYIFKCTDCVLEFNHFDWNGLTNEYGGAKSPHRQRDSWGFIIRYNVYDNRGSNNPTAFQFYDNPGSSKQENHRAYNNLILGGANAGVSLQQEMNNVYYYNNIIIPDSGVECFETLWGPSYGTRIYNNMCSESASLLVDNNDSSSIDTANNITSTSPDINGTGDFPSPEYTPSGSSANTVDSGTSTGYTGADYDGNNVPQEGAYDIGMFEYTPPSNNDGVSMSSSSSSSLTTIEPEDQDDVFVFALDVTSALGDDSASWTSADVTLNCSAGTATSGEISDIDIYKETAAPILIYRQVRLQNQQGFIR
jgi:hypothetical protein